MQRKTVLVLERDPTIQAVVKSLLEMIEFEALAASGAREAIDEAVGSRGRICAAIIDIDSCDAAPVELADVVEKICPWVRVLFSGAFVNAESPFLIRKPFDAEELLSKIMLAAAEDPAMAMDSTQKATTA